MAEENNGFQPIETQEQLDSIIKERLKRDRESTAKKYEGWISPEDHQNALNDANKALDDYKKAHEGDEQLIADLTAKNKAYETASLKSRIAHEVGLSYEWISRIGGEDEASIRADAESLKKLVGTQNTVIPTKNTESSQSGGENSPYKTLLEGIKKE